MTIAEVRGKCKGFLTGIPPDMLIIGILVLASSASFGLGYFAGLDAHQVSVEGFEALPVSADATPSKSGQFVASMNGTKYYPTGCAGADRISPTNKVWFASAEAAVAAGYAPAANCK
ncbi:MAG: hypothetical protein WCT41_01405 [Candidatus Paceibacterota bacterium]|jgi:hypothetical protein